MFRHPARWRQVGAVLSPHSMVRLDEGAGFGSWGCEAAMDSVSQRQDDMGLAMVKVPCAGAG